MANEALMHMAACPECSAIWKTVGKRTRLRAVRDRCLGIVSSYACPDCGQVWLRYPGMKSV